MGQDIEAGSDDVNMGDDAGVSKSGEDDMGEKGR